jgi:5-methylcytosine-specific restriction endonuclease McrA
MSNHKMSGEARRRRKRSLFARYGCYCYHCGNCFSIQQLTLDHLTPRSRGGSNALFNLRLACFSCNNRRGAALV